MMNDRLPLLVIDAVFFTSFSSFLLWLLCIRQHFRSLTRNREINGRKRKKIGTRANEIEERYVQYVICVFSCNETVNMESIPHESVSANSSYFNPTLHSFTISFAFTSCIRISALRRRRRRRRKNLLNFKMVFFVCCFERSSASSIARKLISCVLKSNLQSTNINGTLNRCSHSRTLHKLHIDDFNVISVLHFYICIFVP